jgi:hypothetical protein
MGQNPSGISTRIDKARLIQDLGALEELVMATPGFLNGPSRLRAFQFLDAIAHALKRHNMYADVRLELSIAIRAIPPRIDEQMAARKLQGASEVHHTQVLESIAFLRTMLDERWTATAV